MHNDKQTTNQLAVGLAGALIGALGASAILLSDSETRRRAKKMAIDAKEKFIKWSTTQMRELDKQKEMIEETKSDIKKEMEN